HQVSCQTLTCSVCPTVFGALGSHYQHSGQVHVVISILDQICSQMHLLGCQRAILKQFVKSIGTIQINTGRRVSTEPPTYQNDLSQSHDTHSDSNSINTFSSTAATTQTIKSYKQKQKPMEEQVYQIWTVLSTSKGSGAACISQMLRHVNSGLILEGVQMA
ncbi:hypothetical protein PSTT_05466, partial [Puccinia striiformis]